MFNEIPFYTTIYSDEGGPLYSKQATAFSSMFDVNQSSDGQLCLEIDSLADAFQSSTTLSRFDFLVALGGFFWSIASGRCCYEAYKLAKKLGSLPDEAEARLTAIKKSPFRNKMCVITGEFEKIERTEVLFEIVKRGGRTSKSLVNSTDILIVGMDEWFDLRGGVSSSKIQRAVELQEKGKKLQIISEGDFYAMIGLEL